MANSVKVEMKKKALLSSIVLLVLTYFVFQPFQLWYSNRTELWFSWVDCCVWSLVSAAITAVVLWSLSFVIRSDGYYAIIWGVSLALYIQGNFIMTKYGVFDGKDINWGEYRNTAIWNTAVWLFLCVVLPLFLKRKYTKQFSAIVVGTSLALVAVQILAIVLLVVPSIWGKRNNEELYLSDKGLYDISDERNIIVFVLDTYGEDVFKLTADMFPESVEFLDGFRSYTNASCSYYSTYGSVPYILTDVLDENEVKYGEYVDAAWEEKKVTDYYSGLRDRGYQIGIYTNDLFVSNEAKDNLLDNAVRMESKPNSYVGLWGKMLEFSSFRCFPHVLKKYVWLYGGDFDKYKTTKNSDQMYYSSDNVKFYNGLMDKELTVISTAKQYKVIHLDGEHPPFELVPKQFDGESIKKNAITESLGLLEILKEYMDQLKSGSCYDNSLIIITADHGYVSKYQRTNPLFLIKDYNSRGDIEYYDDPISHSNIMGTIVKSEQLENDENYSASIYDICNDKESMRPYYYYYWDYFGY